MWRTNGDAQRCRGRSRTSPKAKFGEKVLHKVAKTVYLSKSEARWREGLWLGMVETSDEHLIGTKLGAIKCHCIAGVSDNLDAKIIEEMRGQPWQPSTRHTETKTRTHIDEDDGAGDADDVEKQPAPQADAEAYPDHEEQTCDVVRAQELLESRVGQSYKFYIRARATCPNTGSQRGARGASTLQVQS